MSQGDASPVLMFGADGVAHAGSTDLADAQGLAVAGAPLLVADPGRRELVVFDVASGERTRRRFRRADRPAGGRPRSGRVHSVCADGAGGFYVGCNGDGSIRQLRRAG